MRLLFVIVVVCMELGIIWATAEPPNVCTAGCTCEDADDADSSSSVTKHEGLAAAVGALTPLVLGGAGLGLYKFIKGGGSPSPSAPTPDGPDFSSPRYQNNRGSVPSNMDSPDTYRSNRRGSTPVSMFGEDDDISFNESLRGPANRPDTQSTFTNIHRARKSDAVNRWM